MSLQIREWLTEASQLCPIAVKAYLPFVARPPRTPPSKCLDAGESFGTEMLIAPTSPVPSPVMAALTAYTLLSRSPRTRAQPHSRIVANS